MAAGAGEASLILGFVSTGLSFAKALTEYVQDYKSAPEEIKGLGGQIEYVLGLVVEVEGLLKKNEVVQCWSDVGIKRAKKNILDCQAIVETLRNLLQKTNVSPEQGNITKKDLDLDWLHRAIWPIGYKKQFQDAQRQLHRLQSDITISYLSYQVEAGSTKQVKEQSFQELASLIRADIKAARRSQKLDNGHDYDETSSGYYNSRRSYSYDGDSDEAAKLDAICEGLKGIARAEIASENAAIEREVESKKKLAEAAVKNWREDALAQRKKLEGERESLRLKLSGSMQKEKVEEVVLLQYPPQAIDDFGWVLPLEQNSNDLSSGSARGPQFPRPWKKTSILGQLKAKIRSEHNGAVAAPAVLDAETQELLSPGGRLQWKAFLISKTEVPGRMDHNEIDLSDQWFSNRFVSNVNKKNPFTFGGWEDLATLPSTFQQELSFLKEKLKKDEACDWNIIHVERVPAERSRRFSRSHEETKAILIILRHRARTAKSPRKPHSPIGEADFRPLGSRSTSVVYNDIPIHSPDLNVMETPEARNKSYKDKVRKIIREQFDSDDEKRGRQRHQYANGPLRQDSYNVPRQSFNSNAAYTNIPNTASFQYPLFGRAPVNNSFQQQPISNSFQQQPVGNSFQQQPVNSLFQQHPVNENFQQYPFNNQMSQMQAMPPVPLFQPLSQFQPLSNQVNYPSNTPFPPPRRDRRSRNPIVVRRAYSRSRSQSRSRSRYTHSRPIPFDSGGSKQFHHRGGTPDYPRRRYSPNQRERYFNSSNQLEQRKYSDLSKEQNAVDYDGPLQPSRNGGQSIRIGLQSSRIRQRSSGSEPDEIIEHHRPRSPQKKSSPIYIPIARRPASRVLHEILQGQEIPAQQSKPHVTIKRAGMPHRRSNFRRAYSDSVDNDVTNDDSKPDWVFYESLDEQSRSPTGGKNNEKAAVRAFLDEVLAPPRSVTTRDLDAMERGEARARETAARVMADEPRASENAAATVLERSATGQPSEADPITRSADGKSRQDVVPAKDVGSQAEEVTQIEQPSARPVNEKSSAEV